MSSKHDSKTFQLLLETPEKAAMSQSVWEAVGNMLAVSMAGFCINFPSYQLLVCGMTPIVYLQKQLPSRANLQLGG